MKKQSYISSKPDTMGGAPVITGTRIPIARILFLLKEGYTLEAIHDEYSWVPLKTIARAVDELVEKLSSSQDASEILQA